VFGQNQPALFLGWWWFSGKKDKYMHKQHAQNKPFQESDYNEPTEPLEVIELPIYGDPSYAVGDGFPAATTVPAAQAAVRLPPTDVLPAYPYHQPYQADYPVLPPLPRKKYRGSPPGGYAPYSDRVPARRRGRSPLPGFVRLGFVLVQLVLLTRVVCLLFGVQSTTRWLTILFAAGDLFVQPVSALAANINLSVLAGTPFLLYLEFLVAILAYGLLSRLLTPLLRALLN
jgi:hypothetical protein